MLTTRVAARELGVTPDTVRAWIRGGRIEAVRLPSGQYRISEAELERFRRNVSQRATTERRRQWKVADAWMTSQPVPTMSFEEALDWVSGMIAEAGSHGDLVEKRLEEKAEGYRTMRRALAFIRPADPSTRW